MPGLRIISNSPVETQKLAEQLGLLLSAGAFIALQGGLGGGKTCFTHGIVAALAPQSAHLVASPTFSIMNSYSGNTPVYHFDFYRLTGDNDIAELGLDDYFSADGVSVVEWSERLCELLPDDYITAEFEVSGESQRSITLTACGLISTGTLEQLAQLRKV